MTLATPTAPESQTQKLVSQAFTQGLTLARKGRALGAVVPPGSGTGVLLGARRDDGQPVVVANPLATPVDQPSSIGARAVTHGTQFTAPVSVSGQTVAIFVGCTFTTRVTIAAASKAMFVGCFFVNGSNEDGDAISNAAAALAVQVIGCNYSGWSSFGTVTTVGCV